MDFLQDLWHHLHGEELRELIQWGGFLLLIGIVYAETGLLVGFFLPGDSLLFTAGALIGAGILKAPAPLPQDPFSSLIALIVVLSLAAIAGDATGYWFGRGSGHRLYERPDGRIFKRKYLLQAQAFYEKHGGKTIILARWVPIVRTFAPIVAGVAKMDYRHFTTFNVVGGISWVGICSIAGFALGNLPWVAANFEKVVLLIVALSVAPAVLHVLREVLAHGRKRGQEVEAATPGTGRSSSRPDP